MGRALPPHRRQGRAPRRRVFYRHGYYARAQLIHDRRQFTTYSRILSAAVHPEGLHDIKVKQRRRSTPPPASSSSRQIDLTRVQLSAIDGRHTGRLDIALFAVDSKAVSPARRGRSFSLASATNSRAGRDGMNYTAHLPVRAMPLEVKVACMPMTATSLAAR